MKKKLAKLFVALTLLSLAVFLLLALHGIGLRVNMSGSLPGLVYRAVPLPENAPVLRGDRILVDIGKLSNPVIELGIERGYMRGKQAMLKEIGAVPNDIVRLWRNRFYVNADSIPMIVVPEDSRGGKLTAYPTPSVISPDHYWLISAPNLGFDSRYFGPVNRSAFTHKAYILF